MRKICAQRMETKKGMCWFPDNGLICLAPGMGAERGGLTAFFLSFRRHGSKSAWQTKNSFLKPG